MGNAKSNGEDGSTFDLFDRWLAHREQQAAATGADEREPVAPVAEALAPEPVPDEPAVDPLFDAAFVETVVLEDESAPLAPDDHPDLLPVSPPEPEAIVETPSQPEPEPETERAAHTDNVAMGRAIIDALATPAATVSDEPPVPAAVAVRARVAVSEAVPVIKAPKKPKAPREPRVPREAKAPREPRVPKEPKAPRAAKTATAPEQVPHTVEFAPRVGTRRVVGLLLLVALAATAVSAYAAYQDRSTTNFEVAGGLAVLTAILWAIWASSSVTTLSVRGGQLEIVRAGSRHRFDMASDYTPIEIIGEPGSRNWKVLFHRKSMAPFVVDASMVDPAEFTRVVRHYRPSA